MLVELTYRGNARARDADAHDYRFDVKGWRDQERLRTVLVRVSDPTKVRLVSTWSSGSEEEGSAKFERAMLKVCVRRIEARGVELLDDLETLLRWEVEPADIQAAAADRKVCSHQERRGPDLFCIAAQKSPSKGPASLMHGATTLHACENVCALPDTQLLCSGFVHVSMDMAHNFPPHPVVMGRVCEKGQQSAIEKEPIGCIPGGNDCWHRVLDLSLTTPETRLSPLALSEAIDFLSWIWKERFPQSSKKLIQLSSASPAAEIAQGCSSPEEFRSRMNALKDVLDALSIDGGLVPAGSQQTGHESLFRMRQALKGALPQAEYDRAEFALTELQYIVDLRNGLHHADAGKKIPPAARRIGIEWPPRDWEETWSNVRDKCARSLVEVRKAIQATL